MTYRVGYRATDTLTLAESFVVRLSKNKTKKTGPLLHPYFRNFQKKLLFIIGDTFLILCCLKFLKTVGAEL